MHIHIGKAAEVDFKIALSLSTKPERYLGNSRHTDNRLQEEWLEKLLLVQSNPKLTAVQKAKQTVDLLTPLKSTVMPKFIVSWINDGYPCEPYDPYVIEGGETWSLIVEPLDFSIAMFGCWRVESIWKASAYGSVVHGHLGQHF